MADAGEVRPCRPWVTLLLVGLNVVLFFVMVAAGVGPLRPTAQSLSRWGADVGPLTAGGQWWRLLTCLFLHAGALHLLFNMWVLWIIGGILERLVGKFGFAVTYLLAGVYGSLASILWNPDVVSVGASGAIFGLYGALLGFLVRERQCLPQAVRQRLARTAFFFIV